MLMSDNISSLMHPKTSNTLSIHSLQDPEYIRDLKTHLQENKQYRHERQMYRNSHTNLPFLEVKDRFFQEYTQLFFYDLKWYYTANNPINLDEAATAFCKKYNGYSKLFGYTFVLRGFKTKIWEHIKGV